MKLKIIPYLLFILLPIQLGKFFFLPESYIKGLRSDYLAISLYLTDIIIFLIIGNYCIDIYLSHGNNKKPLSLVFLLSFLLFFYLFLSSFFVSIYPFVSLFKLLKLTEMSLLCFVLLKSNLNILKIIISTSIGAVYSCILAIIEVVLQKSAGGLWWFLGERTFSVSTPGISAMEIFGRHYLRPYATFSHPNVLGGFLALVILLILWVFQKERKISKKMKVWLGSVAVLSFGVTLMTFSRSAWIALGVGSFFLFNKKGRVLLSFPLFYFLLLAFSFFLPLFVPSTDTSISERKILIEKSFQIISHHPFFGVGLNQFISSPVQSVPMSGIFIFQPVHNVFLLLLSETGIIGVFLLMYVFLRGIISNTLRTTSFFPVVFSLFLLSLFDHYLFTLQQGELMVVLVVSLAFSAQKKYT